MELQPEDKMEAPIKNKSDEETDPKAHAHSDHEDPDIDAHAQSGVQAIEAMTVTWTKKTLVIAYVLIWFIYFWEGLLAATATALNPYVTSNFAEHSLTPTVGVMSAVIGGVTNLTLAKVLDVFGRSQGYLLCIVLATIGLIMMAACNAVEAYAAAQVFYTVGNNGLQYSLSVFIADTSALRNRGLMQAFAYSPNLITCWLAGPLSSAFLSGVGWRWCFGMFAIIVPAITLPLFGVFWYNHRLAEKNGVRSRLKTGRAPWRSLLHYLRDFDAIGLLLLSTGVAFFLLPFDLFTVEARQWSSPLIICFLVFGILLLLSFIVWERFFAPVTFIPYDLLLDRTAFGACILSLTLFLSYFCWNGFFGSFLQIVNGLSIIDASYVIQTYTVGSCLSSIAVGLIIRYTGRFKPITLFFGVPTSILGVGLLVYFRHAGTSVGYLVMCEIFISMAAGTVIITSEIAILATAKSHQDFAVAIAVLGMFGNVGGAVGLTVASATWQAIFPVRLAEYLPASELPNLLIIFADINTQLAYPIGSAARTAIQDAYSDAQMMILIASAAFWILGLGAVVAWRDIKVFGVRQVKGQVF